MAAWTGRWARPCARALGATWAAATWATGPTGCIRRAADGAHSHVQFPRQRARGAGDRRPGVWAGDQGASDREHQQRHGREQRAAQVLSGQVRPEHRSAAVPAGPGEGVERRPRSHGRLGRQDAPDQQVRERLRMWFFSNRLSNRQLLLAIDERTTKMSTEVDDLKGAVAAITTAVGDASTAIKDLSAKLASASSTNPADVETAANQLNAIAKGLESVVQAAGEPVTPPAQPETPTPPAAPGDPSPAVAVDPAAQPAPEPAPATPAEPAAPLS